MMTLSKKAARLLAMLGAPWAKRIIDLELCVYRDLGRYDIEVSCHGSRTIDVYVWQKAPLRTVEKRYNLPTVEAAYAACRELEAKYDKLSRGEGKEVP